MRVLPFEKNPWIKTYQLRNYELGILQEKQPWIFSKYINIYYDQKKFNHLMLTGRYFEEESVMHVQKFRFDKSIISLNVIDYIKWAHGLIEDGWYIYVFLDEFYLDVKESYQKKTLSPSVIVLWRGRDISIVLCNRICGKREL